MGRKRQYRRPFPLTRLIFSLMTWICSGLPPFLNVSSIARSSAGERMLADWFLEPGEQADVVARQQAVAELRSRNDLREEMALMGDDVRAAADDKAPALWGALPPIRFFPGARILAFLLASASAITFVLFLVGILSVRQRHSRSSRPEHLRINCSRTGKKSDGECFHPRARSRIAQPAGPAHGERDLYLPWSCGSQEKAGNRRASRIKPTPHAEPRVAQLDAA